MAPGFITESGEMNNNPMVFKRHKIIGLAGMTALGVFAYVRLLRPWHLHWGTTSDEVTRAMPGDDLITHPAMAATHALTIHAPMEQVWAWLVQIGQGRGGFYSADSLHHGARHDAGYQGKSRENELMVTE